MSETTYDSVQPAQPPAPVEPPVPLAMFAATLRPRRVALVKGGRPVIRGGAVVMTVTPGHPDEVWLKLLKIRHGAERHTHAEWAALIDAAREEPAHPTVAGVR